MQKQEIKGEEVVVYSIYPNPADTFIAFQLPDTGRAYKIFLFDHSGKMIRYYMVSGGAQTMNIADLENGTYQIRIISMRDRMTAPIVIQH